MNDSVIKFSYNNHHYELTGVNDNDHIVKVIKNSSCFYERRLLEKIKNLNLVGSYIDCGANIGNHTLFFAKECLSTKVISFEIHPTIFEVLEKNIKLNSCNNTILYNVGLGDTNSLVALSDMDVFNVGMVSVISEGIPKYPIRRLDDVIDGVDDVVLIKIDVEGFELNVIKGAEILIKKCSPIIVVECRTSNEFDFINNYLITMGYYTDRINYASTPTYIFIKK